MNTRRVVTRVQEIRSQPAGRTQVMSLKLLAMLRAVLQQHPQSAMIREQIETLEKELETHTPTRLHRMLFGEFASRWVAERRKNGSKTALDGAFVRQRIEPALGKRPIDEITAADVRKWVESRNGSKSRAAECDVLRSILLAAVGAGHLKSVPGSEFLR